MNKPCARFQFFNYANYKTKKKFQQIFNNKLFKLKKKLGNIKTINFYINYYCYH